MKKMIPYILGLCLSTGFGGPSVLCCSVFSASGVDKIYAGTNKDWNNIHTRIRFYEASEGKYGRVYFGYQVSEGFQNVGGMNEHGLWYDGASLPYRSDIHNHFNKPTIKGELCEKALEECRTVEEVIQLYKQYYTPHWQGHSMWADLYGNSVIIEYGEKDVVFIRKEDRYQVMTNYYLSDTTNLRWSSCHRFNAITEVLENGGKLSVELMTRALELSHKEGLIPTLFSNVYDLKNGEIYIYHFHYYGEYVRINLAEELLKGDRYLDLPGLFSGIHLKSPSPGQELNGEELIFEWSGEASEYEIRYSPDKEFHDFKSVRVRNPNEEEIQMQGCLSVWIIIFAAGILRIRKRQSLVIFVGLMLLASCSACSKMFISPELPESMDYAVQVYDLAPGEKYYWKVLALGEDGIHSESTLQSFTIMK